jgi:hypothetical protein
VATGKPSIDTTELRMILLDDKAALVADVQSPAESGDAGPPDAIVATDGALTKNFALVGGTAHFAWIESRRMPTEHHVLRYGSFNCFP